MIRRSLFPKQVLANLDIGKSLRHVEMLSIANTNKNKYLTQSNVNMKKK